MLKRNAVTLPLLALAIAAGTGLAQNQEAPKASEPPKFYRLDFVVKEVEGGKVLNARAYSMIANTSRSTSIRAGSRVAVPSGTSVQYLDVGVNIDCSFIAEVKGDLSLSVTAEVSSIPSEPATSVAATPPPTIRQNRWNSPVILPLRKPTLLFSSDDLASKRQMQLELTATPIT